MNAPAFQHQSMAAGRWFTYSLSEQLGNIGSEVGRANRWKEKDARLFESAVFRAIELLDLTLSDARWKNRLKEIARAKETLCDAFTGGKEYNSSFADLEKYFYLFAYLARNSKR
ncbi:MAG: hypothetical protein A2W17_08310 [Planctomycetes bacterium RBG_16_41_13]|nr:MAG: hypothetical protein A2W17_08310 [Planctomycetes bacterium RBG_16_41_13]